MPANGRAENVRTLVAQLEPRLLAEYEAIHAAPELGFQEKRTAERVATALTELGYEVHREIAVTGVVGMLRNGPGPVVMFRADMDALPLEEKTKLPFASRATAKTARGTVPVMHACGHDVHIASMIGVAKIMKELARSWSGTLVLVAQPAEELLGGARAMVAGGLYNVAPVPSALVAAHVFPYIASGQVGIREGRRLAGVDTIDLLFHGKGGHGSAPELAIDPIVMGSRAVLDFQTLISRETSPFDSAVLTVGAFRSGEVSNVIPDSAELKISIRWWDERVRRKLLEGIERISRGVAIAAGVSADRMPEFRPLISSAPVINDDELSARLRKSAADVLGADNVTAGAPPIMGSEDFPDLRGPHENVKIGLIEVGAAPPAMLAEARAQGKNAPYYNHSPHFFVDRPAVAAGTKAIAMGLLDLLAPV